MRENISPEEKLLRLIKAGKKPQPPDIAKIETSEKEDVPKAPALKEKKPKIKLKMPSFKVSISGIKNNLNFPRLVKIILGLSFLYIIFVFVYPFVAFRNIPVPEVIPQTAPRLEEQQGQEVKPPEFYLQGLSGKKIFANSQTQQTSAAHIPDADLIKDINLVGIISGDNPQAIIEDKKAQKTYYLSKGQAIGIFQIEDIQDSKIILSTDGKRYELFM